MSQSTLERPASTPAFIPISTARRVKNSVAGVLVAIAFVIAVIPLVWLLITVVSRGISAVIRPGWWVFTQRGVLPDSFGGGAAHAIYGTLVQGLVCAVIAVPLGMAAAVYLVEYGRGRLARTVTFMVDILSGVPSIVAALFLFAVWITTFGLAQSAFVVSLALVLLMLPIVIRSTEEMLRLVPDRLRESAYALGIPKWKTIMRIVLPTAMSGIVTGVMLSVARVMGETAPVLVLVGYSTSMNYNPFDGNMASLPLLIYTQLTNPLPAGQERVWGAALTLIIVVMLFNLIATLISRASAIKTR